MRNSNPQYPRSYYALLLSLSPDGTPLTITYPSPEAADAERLKFYNFLKWCRRPLNASAVVHLEGRYNLMSIKRNGPDLVFALRTADRFFEQDDLIMKHLEAQGVKTAEVMPPPSFTPEPVLPRGEARPAAPGWDMPADLAAEAIRMAQNPALTAEPKIEKATTWFPRSKV